MGYSYKKSIIQKVVSMNADCTVYKTTVNCINCDQLLCLILVRLGQVSTLIGLLLITELGARQFFSIAKTTKRHCVKFP